MKLIDDIQLALRKEKLAGWLFYDFRHTDPIATRILRFRGHYHVTRRWFYLVPAEGNPIKLVHQIENSKLDHLPGEKRVYVRWEELQTGLKGLLTGIPRVAMQYSENNLIPYISKVDAGTLELVRSCGPTVVSSGDLIQQFECVWSAEQLAQHRRAAESLTAIVAAAFEQTMGEIRSAGRSSERAIQEFIYTRLAGADLETDSPPIVAVNQNSGNPHYHPKRGQSDPIRAGDFLLIDLWARPPGEGSVYADITWTAFFGDQVPEPQAAVFEIVREARDAGVSFLRDRIRAGRTVQGWEVDDAVREVIEEAGHGEHFVHRTGHNLGHNVHGNGVNFDNLETHDTRRVMPGVCCTIEPGIYLKEFGIRSEINVHVGTEDIEVTTPPQTQIVHLKV